MCLMRKTREECIGSILYLSACAGAADRDTSRLANRVVRPNVVRSLMRFILFSRGQIRRIGLGERSFCWTMRYGALFKPVGQASSLVLCCRTSEDACPTRRSLL